MFNVCNRGSLLCWLREGRPNPAYKLLGWLLCCIGLKGKPRIYVSALRAATTTTTTTTTTSPRKRPQV